ncbi:hypothetical protein CALCODRAFT_543453 [Calocera cornea HHB12733]|uniref:Uncharacterized protein n=1 Tax=Calocera cornea HHB12733 TaxID=1353952 RepID=A0A165FFA8_9BASI|nr:hypothetical protein CALCODRAFT_543453 [Calocera cornea HHB12733]
MNVFARYNNPYPGNTTLDGKGYETPQFEQDALYAFSLKRSPPGAPPAWQKVLFAARSPWAGTMFQFCPNASGEGCHSLATKAVTPTVLPNAYGRVRLFPPRPNDWTADDFFDTVSQTDFDSCETDVDCIVAVLKQMGEPFKQPETWEADFRDDMASENPELMGPLRTPFVERKHLFLLGPRE